jgi:hypothetical protein
VQDNEFIVLFQLVYWVAQRLDRIIPGHSTRVYPCLNIRILANPLVFFVLLFSLLIWIKITFKL